jgi:hypothetical protein
MDSFHQGNAQRLRYLQDYLYGHTDRWDYQDLQTRGEPSSKFIGLWIPGHGINHSATHGNMTFQTLRSRTTTTTTTTTSGTSTTTGTTGTNNNNNNNHKDDENDTTSNNSTDETGTVVAVVHMIATQHIPTGQEILYDYRLFGRAPDFVLQFAQEYQMTLSFPGCNDFVES